MWFITWHYIRFNNRNYCIVEAILRNQYEKAIENEKEIREAFRSENVDIVANAY